MVKLKKVHCLTPEQNAAKSQDVPETAAQAGNSGPPEKGAAYPNRGQNRRGRGRGRDDGYRRGSNRNYTGSIRI